MRVPTLRETRIRKLLSIRELAKRAAVSPRTVVEIEAGRIKPRFSTMRKIATALGVEPESITEFTETIDEALSEERNSPDDTEAI